MADNTQLDLGTGGDLISTDDIGGGVKVQRVKVQHGADGSATDVSTASPMPVGDAGGSLTVDVGTALPAGNNNIGDVDVASLPALPAGTNNIGDVDVLTLPALPAGTNQIGQVEAVGDVASDSPIVANPVTVGARASTATPTAVSADGDAVNVWADRRGAQKMVMVDDAGDSIMDDANNAIRVNVIAGSGGGVSHTDDAAFTVGSSAVVPAAGTYRTTRDNVDDGDAGALAMTQKRGLLVAPETPAGDSLVDDTNDHLKVGGPVAHDSANAGNINPLLMGARAANSPLAAVSADGDAVMLRADRLGQLGVRIYDSAGDSCIDDANDALRVNVVAGGAA